MATVTETRQIDFETFCQTIAEGQKADLIDGVIYMASPDNTDAADLSFWLARIMADFADERDLGKIYQSRVACKLGRTQGPEPDVLFVHKSRASIVFPTFIDGAPDLAVEIVSPDSVERDYVFKRRLYEQSGVAEYWIIDEMQTKATFLRLDARGKYREVKPKKGVFTSTGMEGFWLRVEWLFKRPLPKKSQVLAAILAAH